MAATIVTKNSSTTGAVPTSGDLVQGELAVNVTDTGLYTENASGTVVKLNAPSIDDKNTGATKYVTIASGGNVGIGTSNPQAKITVASSGAYNGTVASRTGLNLDASIITGGFANSRIQWSYGGLGTSTKAYIEGGTYGSDYLAFSGDGSSEDMRIDSSGNLLVGVTSNIAGNWASQFVTGTAGVWPLNTRGVDRGMVIRLTGSSGFASYFEVNNGTNVGSIALSATATTYNTSSDYRLKHDIQPMTGALAKVALLKPCTYKWKADGSDGEGFIAHELAEVVPDCVTGEKDAVETYVDEDGNEQTRPVYQGIDTSFLVATLTAAIQELNAKFEEYKAAHP